MDTITINADALNELLALVANAETSVGQVRARLEQYRGGETESPVLSPAELARVEKVGEVAHRHLAHLEETGDLTLGDSLAIRRDLYGNKIRSTANLFGVKDSGALFYRERPYGSRRRDDDPVRLTEEGMRVAELWRELHDIQGS